MSLSIPTTNHCSPRKKNMTSSLGLVRCCSLRRRNLRLKEEGRLISFLMRSSLREMGGKLRKYRNIQVRKARRRMKCLASLCSKSFSMTTRSPTCWISDSRFRVNAGLMVKAIESLSRETPANSFNNPQRLYSKKSQWTLSKTIKES